LFLLYIDFAKSRAGGILFSLTALTHLWHVKYELM
jgi:hypothetical protein